MFCIIEGRKNKKEGLLMITSADYGTFPETVVEFLQYMDAIRNKSPLTISEYASDLRLFFRYMKIYKKLVPDDTDFDTIDISDIDDEFISKIRLSDAYAFLAFCKDTRHDEARTRSRKVSTLRDFFKYCTVNKNIMKQNPMQGLESPKIQKSLPKYLTLDQSLELLKNAATGPYKERDYAIITLFLNCGMRLSELCSLNYNDIRDNNTITITGKGNKQRTVYLNQACIDAVNEYMKVRPADGVRGDDRNALFLSARKQRISPKTVQHIVYQALDKSGLSGQGYSVHKLRHTAATLMYQNGTDVLVLKEILGHENVGTTQIYTHVINEQLKTATENNPLAHEKIKKTSK